MKRKIFSLFAALLLSLAAHAQFEQGKWYANVGFSGLDLNYSDLERWKLDLSAKAGCLFADNWMVTAGMEMQRQTDGPRNFAAGAGLRYYVVRNGLFLGAEGKYVHRLGFDDFVPSVSLGYCFFLNRTVTIEPEFYYNNSTTHIRDYSDAGFRISFGIYFE